MALVTRRYGLVGPTDAMLARFVDVVTPAVVAEMFPTATVDITVDNAIPDIIPTLDEYMATLGFAFLATNPPIRVFEMAADPGGEVDRVLFYNKLVSGSSELFAQLPGGEVYQLTPITRPNALPEQWASVSLLANVLDIPMSAQVSTNFDDIKMIRSGSIVGFSTRLVSAIAAGTLDVEVTLNGAGTGFILSHDNATNSSGGTATQAFGATNYVVGDLIGMRFTTSVGFLPLLNNLEAWIEVFEPMG